MSFHLFGLFEWVSCFPLFGLLRVSNIVTLSTTSPTSLHQSLSLKSLRSSLLWCSITVSRSMSGLCEDSKRKGKLTSTCLYCWFVNSVSKWTQRRSSRFFVHRLRCQRCHFSSYVDQNLYEDHRLRVAIQYLLWRAGVLLYPRPSL